MILSECCGVPFPEPGYPDTDLCGKCYEHTDVYDDEDIDKSPDVSESIKELLFFDMNRRKVKTNENTKY